MEMKRTSKLLSAWPWWSLLVISATNLCCKHLHGFQFQKLELIQKKENWFYFTAQNLKTITRGWGTPFMYISIQETSIISINRKLLLVPLHHLETIWRHNLHAHGFQKQDHMVESDEHSSSNNHVTKSQWLQMRVRSCLYLKIHSATLK